TQLRDPDPDAARKAADALAKHLAAERRDRTRLEVEKLRADAARAKVEAQRVADAAAEDEVEEGGGWVDPRAREREEAYARERAADGAVVWLWDGKRPLGGVAPDPASDVPLMLFADHTVRGRVLYWAARRRPVDTPPPELTPDQRDQLATLAHTSANAA
ncbi:MAG: hypothetical protein K2V38_01530, partial [Gemmataceae bacterium]|nr:hypothetical protein [Gemmataceae bacterium]